jgi:hypothetical protein
MSSELKIAKQYHNAINEDLWKYMWRNDAIALKVRQEIIPRAIKWINYRLWNYHLYVDGNHCYIKKK